MEENLFPSQLSLGSRSELEEERRLFYVAITRAETRLTLSFATSRFRFGTLLPCEPSRFIDEIESEYLQMDRKMLSKKNALIPGFPGMEGSRSNLGRTIQRQRSTVKETIKPPKIANFEPEVIDEFREGMKIEHQRFGQGEIIKLEGSPDQQKAIIHFLEYGQKTLVLKFAKLRLSKF
jgi:DNA helicase-2/ATP-dependent DNA helicase PcrA